MNAARLPYPSTAKQSFWGPPTSLENFCEADYLFTPYIAELVNSLTNLAYLAYAYRGVRSAHRFPDFWTRALPYIGLAGVGIGSTAFHGTMKLPAQWADDLAMFFATGIVLHRVLSYGKDERWRRGCAWLLGGYLAVVAVYHCYVVEVVAHQGSFVVMVIVVAIRTRSLIDGRIHDAGLKTRMVGLSRLGSAVIFAAWVLWNLDNMMCKHLKVLRATIGLPWGLLLELHGWWHLLTAISVYIYMVIVEHLTADCTVEESIEAIGACAWPVALKLRDPRHTTKAKDQNRTL